MQPLISGILWEWAAQTRPFTFYPLLTFFSGAFFLPCTLRPIMRLSPRERVNNIMQEVWHKASPNNRTPFFSLTPSLTPSPTSSPWASLFPSSSVPSSCNLVLRRELFSSCEVVERFLESHWWEKAPRLVLLPFLPTNHQLWSSHLFFLISGLSTSCPVSFFTCSLCILADGKNIFVFFFLLLQVGQENWFKLVHIWSYPVSGGEHICVCVCLGWCWWSHYQCVLPQPHYTAQWNDPSHG